MENNAEENKEQDLPDTTWFVCLYLGDACLYSFVFEDTQNHSAKRTGNVALSMLSDQTPGPPTPTEHDLEH